MEYYPRIIAQKLEKWIKKRKVIVIKGPRQSGKTTLMMHLAKKYDGAYVTLENDDYLKTFEENPDMFIRRFNSDYIFIDEAQYSKKAGKVIKYLYDTYSNLRIFVSGSGSFDIKVLVSKYLVGRAMVFELLPLSFEEFLMWKDQNLADIHKQFKTKVFDFIYGKEINSLPKIAFENEFKGLLEEYLIYGGYPEIVKESNYENKVELLTQLLRLYLEKDVFYFLGVTHLEKFREVVKFLAASVGSIIEISSISSDLKMDYKTVNKYLNILVNSYIIKFLSPFRKNLVTELKKSKKIYFVDLGFRNALINMFSSLDFRIDRGQIFENFILNELRDFELKYWRTTSKAEVDLVLFYNDEVLPIEVKSFGKVRKSFWSFLNAYNPRRAIVFSEREYGIKRKNNTEILFVRHWMI